MNDGVMGMLLVLQTDLMMDKMLRGRPNYYRAPCGTHEGLYHVSNICEDITL